MSLLLENFWVFKASGAVHLIGSWKSESHVCSNQRHVTKSSEFIFRLWRHIPWPYLLLKTVRTFQKISCLAKAKTRFFSNLRSNYHFLTNMGFKSADFNSLQIHLPIFIMKPKVREIFIFFAPTSPLLGSLHQFSSFELWRQSLKLDGTKRNSLLLVHDSDSNNVF